MMIAFIFLLLLMTTGQGQTPAADDFQISGTVVDHLTNAPLNHVLVQITKVGKGGDASALTEADGRFTFLHVPKGKYQLMAEKRGQVAEGFHSDGGYATAIVVDGRQNTDGIVFAMRTDGYINATVLGADGEPVQGADLELFAETVIEGQIQMLVSGGRTNSSGQCHFGHLDAGRYYLGVQATLWFEQQHTFPETVYPITFYGDTTDANAARAIVLPEGGSEDVQINLHTVPGIRVKVAGRAQGVGVFISGPGGARISVPAHFVGGSQPKMKNSSDTVMELTNLAAGRYQVMRFGDHGGGGPLQTVDLANGSTLNMDESTRTSITGTVHFEGARPPGDLELFLRGEGGAMAEVNADGTFKVEHAAGGKFEVHLNNPALTITSITARGARIVHDSLEVPAGAAVELVIKTASATALSKVEGFAVRNGAAVAGAMVLLVPQDPSRARLFRRDQSDADGSFNLANVRAGSYTLVAIDDGRGLAYKTETVIRPYLAGGLVVTIPLNGNELLNVPVQARQP